MNPDAIVRQSIQEREAFLEDQWAVFKTTVAGYGLARGANAIGFGKVTGSHMRGTNWPPNPNNSIVLDDPTRQQMTRILLASDRPILEVMDYIDELGSFFGAVQSGLEVSRRTAPDGDQELLSGRDAHAAATEALERLAGMRPLPPQIGDYLARAAVRRAERDNPQIAALSDEERIPFLRDRACVSLFLCMRVRPIATGQRHCGNPWSRWDATFRPQRKLSRTTGTDQKPRRTSEPGIAEEAAIRATGACGACPAFAPCGDRCLGTGRRSGAREQKLAPRCSRGRPSEPPHRHQRVAGLSWSSENVLGQGTQGRRCPALRSARLWRRRPRCSRPESRSGCASPSRRAVRRRPGLPTPMRMACTFSIEDVRPLHISRCNDPALVQGYYSLPVWEDAAAGPTSLNLGPLRSRRATPARRCSSTRTMLMLIPAGSPGTIECSSALQSTQ